MSNFKIVFKFNKNKLMGQDSRKVEKTKNKLVQ